MKNSNKPPRGKSQRPQSQDDGNFQRLNKVLAAAGFGSRRSVDELIEQGRVEVNGEVCDQLGTRVDIMTAKITVDGESLKTTRPVYYAVNKPSGVLCTNRDPQGRPRVVDLVPQGPRLFSIGRLDRNSTGLILLTNDGTLAQKLTHPKYGVKKTYRVVVVGHIDRESLEKLKKGIYLAEGRARVDDISVKRVRKGATELEMVLSEGKNREIRRVLARLGHKVVMLQRVAVGPVRLGNLTESDYRPLTKSEVQSLVVVSEQHERDAERRRRAKKEQDPYVADENRLIDIEASEIASAESTDGSVYVAEDLKEDARFVTNAAQVPAANWEEDEDDFFDDEDDGDTEFAGNQSDMDALLDDTFDDDLEDDEEWMEDDEAARKEDLAFLAALDADDEEQDDASTNDRGGESDEDLSGSDIVDEDAEVDPNDDLSDPTGGLLAGDAVLVKEDGRSGRGRVFDYKGGGIGKSFKDRKPWSPSSEANEGDGRRRSSDPKTKPGRDGDRRDNRRGRSDFEPRQRSDRGDRPYGDRNERGSRPYGDRNERGSRPYGDRNERGSRPYGDRNERGPRPYGDRNERGSRPYGDRNERGSRPYGDRNERGSRPYGDRNERGSRPYGDRNERGSRPYGERSERGPRPYGDRSERGPRPYGDRPERREGRSDGDRSERGPRPYGDRREGGGSRFGDRERGERRPQYGGGDRGSRPGGGDRDGSRSRDDRRGDDRRGSYGGERRDGRSGGPGGGQSDGRSGGPRRGGPNRGGPNRGGPGRGGPSRGGPSNGPRRGGPRDGQR